MRRAALLVLASTSVAAGAQPASPEFERFRRNATTFSGGLATFLQQYIGDCGTDLGCREQAQRFRQQVQGKRLYFSAPEESAALLAPGPENRGSGRSVIDLTPIFAAGGYALTNGTPKKTDAQGNPMISVLPLPVKLPGDRSWNDVKRMVATRAVQVEFVAVPMGVWSLPRPRGGKWYGVTAEIQAVLITSIRTGETVALWMGAR